MIRSPFAPACLRGVCQPASGGFAPRRLVALLLSGCFALLTSCGTRQATVATTPVDPASTPASTPAVSPAAPGAARATRPGSLTVPAGVQPRPVPGAAQLEQYLGQLSGKRVVLVVNHTSRVGRTHLLDTLRARGVNIVRVLAPEHGFRGTVGAGEHVRDTLDGRTGVPITSLYGATKKPLPRHLAGADIVVFDLQDVGARFYTYWSTLHYVLEAAAEQGKPVLVLDRPNPNGDYTDGPVLEADCKSFVGLDPIPIVHGLTLGEAARMMNGEGWLAGAVQATLTVIPVAHYTHATPYELPVAPSPNLPTARAVRLYPSLALFEGTPVSVGRGTDVPFEVVGHPQYPDTAFAFVPRPAPANPKPLQVNNRCYGQHPGAEAGPMPRFTLRFVADFYQKLPRKDGYFLAFFDKLAGTKTLRKQLEAGLSEDLIRASWQPGLTAYRQKRASYLLYP